MFKLNRKSKVYNNGKYSNIQQTGYMYIDTYMYLHTYVNYDSIYIYLHMSTNRFFRNLILY